MSNEELDFDIVVLGGGHAGVEAAWIASDFNLKIALITMPEVPIGSTPCNPSVGGVGKGQVVREIDALGGLMGKLADFSAIQYRTLNESKGPAVQSTRVQVDKIKYQENSLLHLQTRTNLKIIYSKIKKIKKNILFEIESFEGKTYRAKKIIVTTGTFLGGKLHCGIEQKSGGRVECQNSPGLGELFQEVKSLGLRFKTGTPPRLDKKTIDYTKMEEQLSDDKTLNFHWGSPAFGRIMPQTSCFLTRINRDSLDVIRKNKALSPIFNGQISGIGPRYCPSIEDKAFRYPDRHTHHLFLEPESFQLDTVYPNGISTSLPKNIQQEFINLIPGLEEAKILEHGYAVEYDVVDTQKLNHTLMYREIPGLYFAGQVNGTSGYEEAGAQGLIAGANAALDILGGQELILDRKKSYIGVLVDDLVSTRRDEPYRLFTARAENRLYLRDDNAVLRISPYRRSFGLEKEIDFFQKSYLNTFKLISVALGQKKYGSDDLQRLKNDYPNEDNLKSLTLSELLKRPGPNPAEVLKKELFKDGIEVAPGIVNCLAFSEKYSGYIQRVEENNSRLEGLYRKGLDWASISECSNISFECRLRIKNFCPQTFGQLAKIEGIRPATLTYVANQLL